MWKAQARTNKSQATHRYCDVKVTTQNSIVRSSNKTEDLLTHCGSSTINMTSLNTKFFFSFLSFFSVVHSPHASKWGTTLIALRCSLHSFYLFYAPWRLVYVAVTTGKKEFFTPGPHHTERQGHSTLPNNRPGKRRHFRTLYAAWKTT